MHIVHYSFCSYGENVLPGQLSEQFINSHTYFNCFQPFSGYVLFLSSFLQLAALARGAESTWLGLTPRKRRPGVWASSCKSRTQCLRHVWNTCIVWKDSRAFLFASILKGLAATTAFFCYPGTQAQAYPSPEPPGRLCRAGMGCWWWLCCGEPTRGSSGGPSWRRPWLSRYTHPPTLGDHRYRQTGPQGLKVQENGWGGCSERWNGLISQVNPAFLEFVLQKWNLDRE